MNRIATTVEIEKKRNELRREGINGVYEPDSIDHCREFGTCMRDNMRVTDPVIGYGRLVNNPRFKKRQVRWLQQKIRQYPFETHRFFAKLPERFPDYDNLRDVFVDIANEAGSPAYIVTQKDEPVSNIKAYVTKFMKQSKSLRLVVDMAAPLTTLNELLSWALPKVEEIVLLNAQFEGSERKFGLTITLAIQYPDRMHLHGAYWNTNMYGSAPMLAALLICAGFKSVSFKNTEIPPYLFDKIRGRAPRTNEEKVATAVWVNDEEMTYEREHPQQCRCFGGQNAQQLCRSVGVEVCITHHNLSCLTKRFNLIGESEEERRRVLQLPTLQPLLAQMGATWNLLENH